MAEFQKYYPEGISMHPNPISFFKQQTRCYTYLKVQYQMPQDFWVTLLFHLSPIQVVTGWMELWAV